KQTLPYPSISTTAQHSSPTRRSSDLDWMKKKQRECVRFGNLVMEGRDIGTNVFPDTEHKFFLDASLAERARRRAADGVQENLAIDRKSTRLNSSHEWISYAVFCWNKK